MIEIICEYFVKEECKGPFELSYGPGGAWSKLFSDCDGFRGITVLHDTIQELRYLTVEVWDTETHREQAIAKSINTYNDLQQDLDNWSESITDRGHFRVLAQAAVRSQSKSLASASRRKSGNSQRSRRRTSQRQPD
ncbi:MAG: hypothetical protein P1S60_04780 [Anaerolineae bacterium]|nr:hypothetical protein [Anaerolineae bacterium]